MAPKTSLLEQRHAAAKLALEALRDAKKAGANGGLQEEAIKALAAAWKPFRPRFPKSFQTRINPQSKESSCSQSTKPKPGGEAF